MRWACYDGRLESVRLLCRVVQENDSSNLSEYINSVDQQGNSSLILASVFRHQSIVEFLLKSKADPNLISTNGVNAIRAAVFLNSTRTVQRLLEAKADVQYQNEKLNISNTETMIAAYYGNHSVLELLLSLDITWNEKNTNGNTFTDILRMVHNQSSEQARELGRKALSELEKMNETDFDLSIEDCSLLEDMHGIYSTMQAAEGTKSFVIAIHTVL